MQHLRSVGAMSDKEYADESAKLLEEFPGLDQ
jgi:hypothetical protein